MWMSYRIICNSLSTMSLRLHNPATGQVTLVTHVREVVFQVLGETADDIARQGRLVVLDGQDVVAPLVPNLGGDGLLAAHGVDAHQGCRKLQGFQEFGN